MRELRRVEAGSVIRRQARAVARGQRAETRENLAASRCKCEPSCRTSNAGRSGRSTARWAGASSTFTRGQHTTAPSTCAAATWAAWRRPTHCSRRLRCLWIPAGWPRLRVESAERVELHRSQCPLGECVLDALASQPTFARSGRRSRKSVGGFVDCRGESALARYLELWPANDQNDQHDTKAG